MKKTLLFAIATLMLIACNNTPSSNNQESDTQAIIAATDFPSESAMLLAMLDSAKCSCIILNNGDTTQCGQRGVRDLYELVTSNSPVLRGSHIADKIIGRGAAALMVNGGVKRASTHVITTPALAMLLDAGIEVRFEQEIPFVENRMKTGQCPLDSRLQEVDSAHLAMPVIEQFIKDLDAGKIF